jgi:hypothetical protein
LLTVNVCFICRFFHHTNLESYIEASSFVTSSRSLKGSEINRDRPDLARKRDEAVRNSREKTVSTPKIVIGRQFKQKNTEERDWEWDLLCSR